LRADERNREHNHFMGTPSQYNEMIEDVDMLLRFTDFLRSELDAQCHQRALAGQVKPGGVRLG
jgi:hypothetical protein